jgi:hypothetical protein
MWVFGSFSKAMRKAIEHVIAGFQGSVKGLLGFKAKILPLVYEGQFGNFGLG